MKILLAVAVLGWLGLSQGRPHILRRQKWMVVDEPTTQMPSKDSIRMVMGRRIPFRSETAETGAEILHEEASASPQTEIPYLRSEDHVVPPEDLPHRLRHRRIYRFRHYLLPCPTGLRRDRLGNCRAPWGWFSSLHPHLLGFVALSLL